MSQSYTIDNGKKKPTTRIIYLRDEVTHFHVMRLVSIFLTILFKLKKDVNFEGPCQISKVICLRLINTKYYKFLFNMPN